MAVTENNPADDAHTGGSAIPDSLTPDEVNVLLGKPVEVEPGDEFGPMLDKDMTANSVRQRIVPRQDRYRQGKQLRQKADREELGIYAPHRDRPDPLDVIAATEKNRIAGLLELRHQRMSESPFSFLRGAADVMAWDIAHLPYTGLMPVICGDAHLGNVGFYRSPEGDLVIDLNDFDEAHTGAWEWDLRRLTASIWIAGRGVSHSEIQCADAVYACVEAYRNELGVLARTPLLERSFNRIDVDRLRQTVTDESLSGEIRRTVSKAVRNVSDRKLPKITQEVQGELRIVPDPPVVQELPAELKEQIAEALDSYLGTLQTQWSRVVGSYYLEDVALKVVGVGSVGMRAYVALLAGTDHSDVVFLQLKEATRSVLGPFVHGKGAWHAHQGARVVEYQRALQTVSDPLLGWTSVGDRQFYVRQWRNQKGSIDIASITSQALRDYAGIVGRLLAKGHARTSGASLIAGYMGRNDSVATAFVQWAKAYADQTEADWQRFVKAQAKR